MTRPPQFSIVLPTYNSPINHLRAQLQAIRGQLCTSWECLVVDDGSSLASGVRSLLDTCSADEQRIRVQYRPHNGGIAAATNDALDAAVGDYVVFCDHDDLIAVDALQHVQTAIAEQPDADVLYSDEQLIDEYGGWLADYRKPRFSPRRLLGQNYFNHLVVVRRSFLGADRLRAEFEPAQDYDLVLRLTERATAVVHIPQILYSWRTAPGSIALDTESKPGLAAAVERSVAAAVERRALPAKVDMVSGSAVCCRLSATGSPIATAHVDARRLTVEQLDGRIRSSAAEACVIVGADIEDDSAWHPEIVGELLLGRVAVAAPQVAAGDGVLWSSGQSHAPRVHDPLRRLPITNPGPWGAHQVAREVSSVSPAAFVVDTSAYGQLGGFDVELPLADALVEFCERAVAAGWAVVCSPHSTVVLRQAADTSQRGGDEHFSPLGEVMVSSLLASSTLDQLPDSSPYQIAARRIAGGSVRLVTTDVFDTLVHRPVAKPHHLFLTLAAELRANGLLPAHVTDAQFAAARSLAEARAREERWHADRSREVTIEAVWEAMPDAWRDLSAADWRAYVGVELEVEAAALRVHPHAVDILRLAARRGVLCVAVSDIYLSSAQLSYLMRRAGVPTELLSAVVTSADRDICKFDGLLEAVIREHDLPPDTVLHLGDNPLADVRAAQRAGATAIDLSAPDDRAFQRWAEPRAVASALVGGDARTEAMVRQTLLEAGDDAADPSFRFGVAAIGPAMAGFASWVNHRAGELGASTVHFLLREGRVIAELMRAAEPDPVQARLVHASRWGILRAAVLDGTVDELTNALARRGPFSPATVATAFGCDEALVRHVVTRELGDTPDRWEAIRVISRDDELRSAVVARAAELRRGVLRYLEQHILLDDDPLVLCDIGWGGTIQEGITSILRSAGHDNEVVGLYLMLSPSGDDRVARGHRLEGYLQTSATDPSIAGAAAVVTRNPEILEQINTPAEGTLLGFDAAGRPRCATGSELSPSLTAAQRGVLAFASRRASATRSERAAVFTAEHRAGLLRSVAAAIQHPDGPLAAAVGSWHHDDVKGDSPESLLSPRLQRLLPQMSAPQAASVPMDEAYWVQGAAALAAPELLGPVAAIHTGTAPDDVATRSELGLARLAVFAHGELASAALTEEHPWLSPLGWSLLQVDGPVPSVRGVRVDFGSEAAVVQVGEWAVSVTLDDGSVLDVSPSSLADKRITWFGGRPMGANQAFVSAGGHVVLGLADDIGGRVRHIAARCSFRGWPLPVDDQHLALPVVAQRAADLARKAARKGRSVIRR
jgi:FMN phosphatase YigB (HAD superfamily)/GT2 family glycosyltransferase